MEHGDWRTELVQRLWNCCIRNYYSLSGLLAQYVLASLIVTVVVPHALDILFPEGQSGQDTPVPWNGRLLLCSLSWILTCASLTVIWILKRRLPRFRRGKIGIIFAAKHDPELRRELGNLHDRVIDGIAQKDLVGLMEVRTLPPNRNIRTPQDALKILQATNGRVLIWGSFEKVTHQGKDVTGFREINFTCNILPRETIDRVEIIGDSLVGKKWGWDADNSIDRSVVASNVAEVGRYVVGLSLLAEQRYLDGRPILGMLRIELVAKYSSIRVAAEIHRFQNSVKNAYVVCLIEGVRQQYSKELYDERIFAVDARVLEEWDRQLREAIGLVEHVPNAHLLCAIVQFLKGDTTTARWHVCQERQRFPLSRVACDFSEAFLATFCGKYRDAKQFYKRAMRNPRVTEPKFLQPILSFMEQATVKYGERIELLFILGLVNHELNDTLRARAAFSEFVAKADDNGVLRDWFREAQLRIARIDEEMASDPPSIHQAVPGKPD